MQTTTAHTACRKKVRLSHACPRRNHHQHTRVTSQQGGRNSTAGKFESSASAVATPNSAAFRLEGACSHRANMKTLAPTKTATGISVYANPVNARIGGSVVKQSTAKTAASPPPMSRAHRKISHAPTTKNGSMPSRARVNISQYRPPQFKTS